MRGDNCVAGEGRIFGVPTLHSWGKCTMPLNNTQSYLMSNALSGLCIMFFPIPTIKFASWGVTTVHNRDGGGN